jgi:hypothetical protein
MLTLNCPPALAKNGHACPICLPPPQNESQLSICLLKSCMDAPFRVLKTEAHLIWFLMFERKSKTKVSPKSGQKTGRSAARPRRILSQDPTGWGSGIAAATVDLGSTRVGSLQPGSVSCYFTDICVARPLLPNSPRCNRRSSSCWLNCSEADTTSSRLTFTDHAGNTGQPAIVLAGAKAIAAPDSARLPPFQTQQSHDRGSQQG